jgi:hypothetical protein
MTLLASRVGHEKDPIGLTLQTTGAACGLSMGRAPGLIS